MKTKYIMIRKMRRTDGKHYIGCAKKYRDPKYTIGKDCRMNINVDVKLSEEQLRVIQEQTRLEVDDAILSGKLDSYIKETVKSVIKSIVNEEIQTKGYRSYIANRVTSALMDEEVVEGV